jgi:probable H4MPT-linked C1 transfer pathway protein
MNSNKKIGYCGWDIGGAHLKLARCDHAGNLQQVNQLPCPLWQGIDALRETMQQALSFLDGDYLHAITMTGELVDAFSERREGVKAILDCVSGLLPVEACHIFAGQQGWLSLHEAISQWQAVASMNWQASALYAATQCHDGLFIDIGSTTADIVPLRDGQIHPCGYDDHSRQRDGGLVYSGAIRTPLMAIADRAPLNGSFIPLAAEWFASTADVWCLLGQLQPASIQDQSADGQPWEPQYCRQRLARMLATDASQAEDWQWQQVAAWFAEKQLQKISEACLQVLSQQNIADNSPIIGAGVGRFIVAQCAQRLGRPYIDFNTWCQHSDAASDHAPAAALALLAQQQLS